MGGKKTCEELFDEYFSTIKDMKKYSEDMLKIYKELAKKMRLKGLIENAEMYEAEASKIKKEFEIIKELEKPFKKQTVKK